MKIRHPEKINKPSNPLKKKPQWIRSKLSNSKEFDDTNKMFEQPEKVDKHITHFLDNEEIIRIAKEIK